MKGANAGGVSVGVNGLVCVRVHRRAAASAGPSGGGRGRGLDVSGHGEPASGPLQLSPGHRRRRRCWGQRQRRPGGRLILFLLLLDRLCPAILRDDIIRDTCLKIGLLHAIERIMLVFIGFIHGFPITLSNRLCTSCLHDLLQLHCCIKEENEGKGEIRCNECTIANHIISVRCFEYE